MTSSFSISKILNADFTQEELWSETNDQDGSGR